MFSNCICFLLAVPAGTFLTIAFRTISAAILADYGGLRLLRRLGLHTGIHKVQRIDFPFCEYLAEDIVRNRLVSVLIHAYVVLVPPELVLYEGVLPLQFPIAQRVHMPVHVVV